jgi:lysophosphatidylcholine acyltransferase/lyso-PAF acetyltransferase
MEQNNLTNRNARILREHSLVEPIVKNPFIHTLELKLLDKVKIGFNSVTLLPIRILTSSVIFLFAVVLSCIVTAGYTQNQLQEKPFTGWRKACKYVLRFCGRAIAFCFGFHKIKKNGVRATKDQV